MRWTTTDCVSRILDAAKTLPIVCLQASVSKAAAANASKEEVEDLMIEQAEESLRKAQAEIEREIGGQL